MIFSDRIESRKDTEIPPQQGVCLTEGFIADKGTEPFLAVQASKLKTIKRRLCRANDRWIFGRKVINRY